MSWTKPTCERQRVRREGERASWRSERRKMLDSRRRGGTTEQEESTILSGARPAEVRKGGEGGSGRRGLGRKTVRAGQQTSDGGGGQEKPVRARWKGPTLH
eukprot:764673-Hanusia_phi.AAC.7